MGSIKRVQKGVLSDCSDSLCRCMVSYHRKSKSTELTSSIRDTVDSVGLIPKRLPFTTSNTIVRTFRHAVSLDERRAKFKPNLWNRPTEAEQKLGFEDLQQRLQNLQEQLKHDKEDEKHEGHHHEHKEGASSLPSSPLPRFGSKKNGHDTNGNGTNGDDKASVDDEHHHSKKSSIHR